MYSTFGGGGGRKQRPWSNLLIIEDVVVSYTFLVFRSHFEPISSEFEGALHFLHLGWGGGCRKRRPRSNSLITEDLVSHTFFRSISHFRLFLSGFEGVFLFYIWGEGVIENEAPGHFIDN